MKAKEWCEAREKTVEKLQEIDRTRPRWENGSSRAYVEFDRNINIRTNDSSGTKTIYLGFDEAKSLAKWILEVVK